MKFSSPLHSILLLLLLLPSPGNIFAGAQPPDYRNQFYVKFSPAIGIIIAVIIVALLFMGFFSIYNRHCSQSSAAAGSLHLSMRGRRGAAARGLEDSVLETFPIFTYSEVKDHKVGALECAVCLNEFEDDETLRLIPICDHVFHPECIDYWLESHVTCPVCRANLVPQTGDVHDSDSVGVQEPAESDYDGEIVIQVGENRRQDKPDSVDRSSSFEYPNRPRRSWSVRTARVVGLVKYRSHSTGHSMVEPGENLDRFTLRLPEGVRKEMMERAVLNRTGSCAATREGSSRRGRRTGEGSSRNGRFYRKIERSDRSTFFSRGLSMRSSKVVADIGESSGTGEPPVKMPSFKCLEPKTADEVGLILENHSKSPV